ncbi:MAG: 4-(cytidine 5'-diphospho)-2-C-methyl-D-erythritol kinase [Rhodospirillales bacterium]
MSAPAKVNLYLRVVGRRADGYHLLDSLAVFVDLADALTFSLAPTATLRLRGPYAQAVGDGENLVERAGRLLQGAAPPESGCAQLGADVEIEKNIPVAAGLGGGSADAAAALDGLNELWRLGLDESVLAVLAAQLGADVPVCRFGRPALMSGIGDTIVPAPALPEFALLLVNPNRAVATADVFRHLSPPFVPPAPLNEAPSDAAALAEALRQRGNGLTDAAIALCPEIGEALAQLARLENCLLAQMSGSGATCFGLFADLAQAQRAEAQLQQMRPHWFARACRVLR